MSNTPSSAWSSSSTAAHFAGEVAGRHARDGRAFHEGVDAWDNDHERDLDDIVEQRDTVRLSYGQVFRRGCETAAKLGQVLRNHGWDGQATPCPLCPSEDDAGPTEWGMWT